MQGKSKSVCLAAVLALIVSQGAWATYVSIQHNLVDGINDTNFNAGTGKLTWDSTSPNLTLNDPGPLAGTVTNVSVHLETTLAGYNGGTQEATFSGGSFLLKFDFNGSLGQTYAIGGPISGMVLKVASTSATFSTIDSEGLFTALTKNLPNTNDWPDGGGFSSLDGLTLAFGANLAGFDWTQSIGGEYVGTQLVQTIYSILPNDSAAPEPASMILLLAGSALLARRRRA